MRIAAFFRCRPGLLPGVLFALVCVGVFRDAGAQTSPAWNENRITATPPTTCQNGRPVAECPVSGYTFQRAATATGAFSVIQQQPPTVPNYTDFVTSSGQNCYRVIATAAPPFVNSPPSEVWCRTNTAPPNGPSAPGIFVTGGFVAHSLVNATPVFRVSGNPPKLPKSKTLYGLVPIGRVTQSGPIDTYRGQTYCLVEVGKREASGTEDLTNLAAPCRPRA